MAELVFSCLSRPDSRCTPPPAMRATYTPRIDTPDPPDGPPGQPTDQPPDPPSGVPPSLHPYLPDWFGVPTPPFALPTSTHCPSKVDLRASTTVGAIRRVRVQAVRPRSWICYQQYGDTDWRYARTDSQGRLTIDFKSRAVGGQGGWRRLVYQIPDGSWQVHYLVPSSDVPPSDLDLVAAWISGWRVGWLVFGGVIGLILLTWASSVVSRLAIKPQPMDGPL